MDIITILVAFIIGLSFLGEAIFGFGSGLLAVPLLSLLLGVKDAVTLILVFQFCMGLLLWSVRKDIDWHIAKIMTLSVIIGSVAGTLLLSSVPAFALQLFLILFIVAFLIKTTWLDDDKQAAIHHKPHMLVAGFAGGIFQGLIGTGGTIFTMFLSRFKLQKNRLRATLIYLLFLTSVVRLIISAWQGLFTPEILHLTVVSLPIFLLVILVGHTTHHLLSEKHYRLSINVILLVSVCTMSIKLLF